MLSHTITHATHPKKNRLDLQAVVKAQGERIKALEEALAQVLQDPSKRKRSAMEEEKEVEFRASSSKKESHTKGEEEKRNKDVKKRKVGDD